LVAIVNNIDGFERAKQRNNENFFPDQGWVCSNPDHANPGLERILISF